jgi:hypothetical protein
MPETRSLSELAKVIRSKNAGPWEITFDVMFPTREAYELVRDSGVLTRQLIADLYSTSLADVKTCMFFDPALAFKATILRTGSQGSVGERDTFGAQQHAPLLSVAIPVRPR